MSKNIVIYKFKNCNPMMLGHWIIGELEDIQDEQITLSNSVNVYELVDQRNNVNTVFQSDHLNTHGRMIIQESEISRKRWLTNDDPLLEGYEKALIAYRAQKIGLKTNDTTSIIKGAN